MPKKYTNSNREELTNNEKVKCADTGHCDLGENKTTIKQYINKIVLYSVHASLQH